MNCTYSGNYFLGNGLNAFLNVGQYNIKHEIFIYLVKSAFVTYILCTVFVLSVVLCIIIIVSGITITQTIYFKTPKTEEINSQNKTYNKVKPFNPVYYFVG